MKKTIVCGIASLALAATPVFSAFAEAPQNGNSQTGYFTGSKSVNVGEVDETIYSVDINWGDLVFDWKYNNQKNEFEFRAHWGCTGDWTWTEAGSYGMGDYYTDDTCTTKYTDYVEGTSGLYHKDPHNNITVTDNSVNGRIETSVSFTPVEKYSWVVGKFANQMTTTIDRSSETITYGEDIVGGILPKVITVQPKYYGATFYLEKDPNAVVTAESISTSDKFGTIILSIEPDTTPITD